MLKIVWIATDFCTTRGVGEAAVRRYDAEDVEIEASGNYAKPESWRVIGESFINWNKVKGIPAHDSE